MSTPVVVLWVAEGVAVVDPTLPVWPLISVPVVVDGVAAPVVSVVPVVPVVPVCCWVLVVPLGYPVCISVPVEWPVALPAEPTPPAAAAPPACATAIPVESRAIDVK